MSLEFSEGLETPIITPTFVPQDAAEIGMALKGADPNASTEELVRHALRAMVKK